jgi:hypothetical protein
MSGPQCRPFEQREFAKEHCEDVVDMRPAPAPFAVFSPKDVLLTTPKSSWNLRVGMGVALRAGLAAALKPRMRVFPLAGGHP